MTTTAKDVSQKKESENNDTDILYGALTRQHTGRDGAISLDDGIA